MELLSWLRENGPRNGRGAARRPLRLGALEELETREVPAIVLGAGGALTLTGTDGADQIEINRSAAGGALVRVNAQTATFLPGQVKSVSVNAGAGNDVIMVVATAPGVGATVDAGAGDDAVQMALSRPGQIDALGGMSSVHGGDGKDRLDFYDTSNSTNTSYSISSSLLTRTRGSATANVSYSGSENVMVKGGAAGNSYDVTSTDKNTSLDLLGSGANDTFKIGAGTMGAIAGSVHVVGLDGSDLITFEDTAATAAVDYTVEQGPLGRALLTRRDGAALATVTFEAEKALVAAGKGADRIVVDALPASTTVQFVGGQGDDRVEVGGGAQNLALVRGTVRVIGGDGNDTLVVDDSLNGNPESSFYIDSGVVTRHSAGQGTIVYFEQLEDVQVRGGSGQNYFTIDGTTQGAVTRLFGGTGDDLFYLGASFESLVKLKGRLELTGGGGNDRAVINDVSNAESNPIYLITSTELHRSGAQPVQFTDVDRAELSGPDHAIYEIRSTAATMRWNLRSGKGADEFRFGHVGAGLDAVAGQVDIDDFGGYDKVFLYDSASAADAVYSLDADGLNRTTQVATRINLHGHEELHISAGTGNDRLEVAGPTPVQVNFSGGAGTDAVAGSDATDDFFFVTSAGGGFLSVPGSHNVFFASSETLRGGGGNDLFRFAQLGQVAGAVEGGAGSDTIDYATRNTSVTIDLSAGTATSTGGLVGVENAVGGNVADVIVGDGGANLLMGGRGDDVISGGGGTDVLIGGLGADRLDGGAGEDLLIGASTSLDTFSPARLALLAEWQSLAPVQTRVAHIRGTQSGGLNGSAILVTTGPDQTVFDDGVADVLTGAGDADWFFVNLDDTSDRSKVELAN